jgi:hypothetical protein
MREGGADARPYWMYIGGRAGGCADDGWQHYDKSSGHNLCFD